MTGSARFHAGWNTPGYLPDTEPATFAAWPDARDWLAAEIAVHADAEQTWADEHDCDDIPCPTFAENCPWQRAADLRQRRDDLLAASGDEWTGIAAGVAYWIERCRVPGCTAQP